jgi:hypothetical protein
MAGTKAIYYVLPLIFLIIVGFAIYGPEKMFSGLQDAVDTASDYAPDVSIGMNELSAGKPVVQEGVKKGFDQLIKDIERARDSPVSDCFVSSSYLHSLGKNAKITFTKYKNDTEVFIMAGPSGKQEVEKIVIKNITPCVIGWKYQDNKLSIAENFFELILKGNAIDFGERYFMDLDSLTIYQAEEGEANRITYANYDTYVSNDDWIYSPDNKHFCFFPVDNNCAGNLCDAGGIILDDDLVDGNDDHETNSIPYKLTRGELEYCHDGKKYWTINSWIEILTDGDDGEVKKTIHGACNSEIAGSTGCSTHDNDCNDYRLEPQEGKGCLIIASEEDSFLSGEDDCADGLAPIGMIIPGMPDYTSFRDVTGIKESKDASNARELFEKFDWSGGKKSYICHNSGKWYECNLGQKGYELKINDEGYTCEVNTEGNYKWTHTSGLGDNVVLVREITKCEDYDYELDCQADERNVADTAIEICSWSGSSCTAMSIDFDTSDPVVVDSPEDSGVLVECGHEYGSCDEGEECVNGACMKSCSEGCENGKCIEGTCKQTCASNEDCENYEVCIDSLLYYDLKTCVLKADNNYCPDNLIPYNGGCVKPLCTQLYFENIDTTDYRYTVEFNYDSFNYISEEVSIYGEFAELENYETYNEIYLNGEHQYIQKYYEFLYGDGAMEEAQRCFPLKVGESQEVIVKAWQSSEEVFNTKLLVTGKDHAPVKISCNIENEKMECTSS